jgi:predicted DNA-binding transcriptional regulator YafY
MSRTTKRSTRLHELHAFLASKRRAVSITELAQVFGMHRSTINRMLHDLEDELHTALIRMPDRSVTIDRERSEFAVRFSLDEAFAVFQAARLLARYSDKPNPHAVRALGKLGLALEQSRVADQIARHIALTSESLDRPLTDAARDDLRNIETLTRAWAYGTRVRLVQREAPELERLFEPYFIEPSAVGFSCYVIGFDHHRQAIRTFKIERLARVSATTDTYTIPPTFDPLAKLAGAWGVNWGDGETAADVVLWFEPGRAADRVRETHWHETQQREDTPDGGCLLRIRVGSTTEMKPWIRQWGPDCEVLVPDVLRNEIADEMRRAGERYALPAAV